MKPIACLLVLAATALGGLHLALAQSPAVLVEVIGAEMSSLCRDADVALARKLAEACEGKPQCSFTPDLADAAGEACARDSLVLWRCGAGETRSVALAPVAGQSREIKLACEQPVVTAAAAPPATPPVQVSAPETAEMITVTTARPSEPRVEAPVRAAEAQFEAEMAIIQKDLEKQGALESLLPEGGGGPASYLQDLRAARGGAARTTAPSIFPGGRSTMASAPTPIPPARIRLVQATWGGNCRQNDGNDTNRLTKACNGKAQCVFTVASRAEGEPAEACARDYLMVWSCGGDPKLHAARLPPVPAQSREVTLMCPER